MFGTSDLTNEKVQESAPVLMVDPAVEWVKKEHGIMLKDWISGMKDNYYSGFEMEQHTHPLQGGRKIIYVRVGLEKENGYFRNQTKDHYLTTCLLAGELSRMGADVKTDDYGTGQLADVVAKFTIKQPDDSVLIKNIAFEYERKDSHTKEQLMEKREAIN